MKRHAIYILIISSLCCLLLTGCTASVRLGGHFLPVDSQSVTATLKSSDIKRLDKLTALKEADFSGSACWEEIYAWSQAHPEVDVLYTVEFPDGTVVESSAVNADLSALTSEQVAAAAECLPYLPQLRQVKLGGIDQADFIAFSEAAPQITFDYNFVFMGKNISTAETRLDLSGITKSDVSAFSTMLPCMASLQEVDLGGEDSSGITLKEVAEMQALRPDVDFCFEFTLFGKSFTTLDIQMDLNHITMDDEGAAVKEVLPCMTKLTCLDMDSCGVSNEAMAEIRDTYPDIDVVWRINFGWTYSVRTDVIKILASKPSVGGPLSSSDVEVLKYCTKVKYLDLGHNGDGGTGITDISFVSYMPDLEVFIIAMNGVSDISPLADCPKLEYLEIFSTPISDLSPLANSKALRHLRIEYMPNLTDISPLYGLTDLERLWLDWQTPVPAEQIAKMQECAPNCEIDTTGSNRWTIIDLNEVTWVYTLHPRYKLLREQFGYDTLDYSFSWLDPKY